MGKVKTLRINSNPEKQICIYLPPNSDHRAAQKGNIKNPAAKSPMLESEEGIYLSSKMDQSNIKIRNLYSTHLLFYENIG